MATTSDLNLVAQHLADELGADVKAIVAKLEGELQDAGASKASQAEYLALWFRHWADPAFRKAMLQQVGPRHFVKTAQAMVAAHGHPVLPVAPTALGLPPAGPEPMSLPKPIPSPVTGGAAPESAAQAGMLAQ